MMGEQLKAPLLYPCANRVKMPHVGADETVFKPQRVVVPVPSFVRSKAVPDGLDKAYVKRISTGLSFSDDVVKDRCFHSMPYNNKYLFDALDISDLIPTPPKPKELTGRHNPRGSDNRHMPCHIKKPTTKKLKPMKKKILEKAAKMLKNAQNEESLNERSSSSMSDESRPQSQSFFLTETVTSEGKKAPPETDEDAKNKEWDEYLLSILSQNTAEWVVKQRTSPSHKDRLEGFLEQCYGPIAEEEPELVKDNVSEADYDAQEESDKKRWKKDDETMLDKVRDLTLSKGLPTDPYSDDHMAAFYRLPAGFRRAKKHLDKEEAGAINTTAHNIEVVPYKAPPPATLRDYMNPAVGDKMHDTVNRFEQEWLTGAQQIYQNEGDKSRIILDTNNKYRKQLVKECPPNPEAWCEPKKDDQTGGPNSSVKNFTRGLHRWKALPLPIDDTAEKLNEQVSDSDHPRSPVASTKKQSKNNNVLLQIVDDWRSKWHLDMRYADASVDDLIRDMADIHSHIRLKAITTCARAAEYRPQPELGIQLDNEISKLDHVKLLPEKLFIALELCLEDGHTQVRNAAAIALYTLERPVPKAEEILRDSLQDPNSGDRWTAAQCLAYYGECDSEVVGALIWHLLNTEDNIRHEQAGVLLSKLSENSTLVHSMIGEQLNSSSWRHRVMACRVLPKLEGHINKDLVHKLTHIMWTDWHSEVRKVAAQTLGKTGHGKHVHDELRDKIVNSNERARTEAVSKVGHLGIMTAKLLPAFLQCFEDSYVSVRKEVCIACSNLCISDEQILEALINRATFDPIWKVKALAIQALGIIGVMTPAVRECMLWAFRYEDQPGVRVEACHTIVKFKLTDAEVAQILQDRYLVETSEIVKDEITTALEMFNISPTDDMDMLTQIKTEVRKLCTRNNICAKITVNETETKREENMERMIYKPPGVPPQEKRDSPRNQAGHQVRPPRPSSENSNPNQNSDASSRPFSHDTTADHEIQAIFDRYDERGSQYDPSIAESRPQTHKSENGLEDGLNESETRTVATSVSRSKSRVTFASPEADYQEIAEGEDGGSGIETPEGSGQETPEVRSPENFDFAEPTSREVVLGEAQSFVEIPVNDVPEDLPDNVLQIKHESPASRQVSEHHPDQVGDQTCEESPDHVSDRTCEESLDQAGDQKCQDSPTLEHQRSGLEVHDRQIEQGEEVGTDAASENPPTNDKGPSANTQSINEPDLDRENSLIDNDPSQSDISPVIEEHSKENDVETQAQ